MEMEKQKNQQTENSLAKKHSAVSLPNSSTSLVIKAGQSSGLGSSVTQAAAVGYANQIRRMDMVEASARLMMEIPLIAQAYGGRVQIDPEVYKECVRLVLAKFGAIGVNEIREAYRMKAAGELGIEKGKGEMWGGEFNAQQLGDVLTAYMDVRRRALSAYLKLKQAQDEAAEKAATEERMQREYLEKFPELIQSMAEKAQDWRDCPPHYFEEAMRRGLIVFDPGEALEILEDAKELARIEHEEAIEEARTAGKSIFHIQSMERLGGEYGQGGRAKVIARKISLFRKLCNKL